MLVSKRRMWFGSVCSLTVLCIIFIRPVRSWVDRAIANRLVDSHLTVSELHFHPARSSVEAHNPTWQGVEEDRRFSLAADRAWLMYDSNSLIDCKFHISRLLLENSRMQLGGVSATTSSRKSLWQSELAKRVRRLDWTAVREHFESLVIANRTIESWKTKIDIWLEQSDEILKQAKALKDTSTVANNSLRYENELQRRLLRLDQFAAEQKFLMDQFNAIDHTLEAEIKNLHSHHERESSWLVGHTREIASDQRQTSAEFSNRLCVEIACDIWTQHSVFGEVSDRFVRSTLVEASDPIDQNILPASEVSAFSLKNVSVSGEFLHQNSATPFHLCGSVHVPITRIPTSPVMKLQSNFYRPDRRIQVSTIHDPTESYNSIAILSTNGSQTLTRLDINSRLGSLSGTLELTADAIANFDTAEMKAISNSMRKRELNAIVMRVEGSWIAPKFTLNEKVPEWLDQTVSEMLAEQLEPARREADTRSSQQLQRCITKLRFLANEASQHGKLLASAHRAELQDTADNLFAKLEQIDFRTVAERPDISKQR